MANINGWGRGTWDQGAWGTALPVEVSGQAITSAIGSVTTSAAANASPSGVAITSAVGSVTTVAGAIVQPTGVAITSALGTPAIDAAAIVQITGQAITSALGTVIIHENEGSGPNRSGSDFCPRHCYDRRRCKCLS
jgi:hypothetical protein